MIHADTVRMWEAETASFRERIRAQADEIRRLQAALWCVAKAAGGTLRIGPSVAAEDGWVTISRDPIFGDLVVSAHAAESEQCAG